MLELKNIHKTYQMEETEVKALRGVSVSFGENEFVAILGQSGCGKTTLLNVIGGLDHYTEGDLIINGISTKKYKDADWDNYRNRSIGFVFQSYQLISHQSVLNNVELTMTLSGISKAERRRRAAEALEKVGLGDQLNKRPNQMSGGQMQRAAIARALVNDPDIILADEPTGALDSQTSVQIMDLLADIARDRLVVMVTHNPDLAREYATRIIRLVDGQVVEDAPNIPLKKGSVEVLGEEEPDQETQVSGHKKKKKTTEVKNRKKEKKQAMSLFTALGLSFNNLLTKKGRTFLTAFAGAIGIIGIAMILALSTGIQNYIDSVESDTLANYPLQINKESVDLTEMMKSMSSARDTEEKPVEEITEITSGNIMSNMIVSLANDRTENDLKAFKEYIEESGVFDDYVRSIEYGYSTVIHAYNLNGVSDSGLVKVNPSTVMSKLRKSGVSMMMGASNVWQALPADEQMAEEMYELVDGHMPTSYDEVVIAVTESGAIGDYALYSLGLFDQDELTDMVKEVMAGKEIEKKETVTYSFEDLEGLEFTVLANTSYYEDNGKGVWTDRREDEDFVLEKLETEGIQVKVVGIVKVKSGSSSELSVYGGVLYDRSLVSELMNRINGSDIVVSQQENPDTDIFSGLPFEKDDEEQKLTLDELMAYLDTLEEEDSASAKSMIQMMKAQGMEDEAIVERFEALMTLETEATYEGNMETLGVASLDDPSSILIYPKDFETKEKVVELLDAYAASLPEGEELKYTDYVGMLMSSITTIITVITYVLIGFVAISLIVSSIMIGIITYISVLERTKEIGILRAIGASKRDVSRVFNAETLVIGFISGLIGIGIPYFISIFVNLFVDTRFDIPNIMYLPVPAAVLLVLISMGLTLVGGLIPSRLAAKKDPVEALRSE